MEDILRRPVDEACGIRLDEAEVAAERILKEIRRRKVDAARPQTKLNWGDFGSLSQAVANLESAEHHLGLRSDGRSDGG